MKKIFFIFVLVFCLTTGFAEAGYNGLQWGAKYNDIPYPEISENTKAREKKMVGVYTTIFYHLRGNQLKGISYTIPVEKTTEIKSKYKKQIDTKQVEAISQKDWSNLLKEEKKISEKFTSEEIDRESNKMIFLLARGIEEDRASGMDKGNAQIYIYDYNEDTRVYIFENMIEGVTFVVYTQHEQDF